MNRDDVDERLLADYAAGALDARQARKLEARLADDPASWRLVEEYRRSFEALREGFADAPDAEPPPFETVTARVKRARRQKRVAVSVAAVTVAAACVLIAFVAVPRAAQPNLEEIAQAEMKALNERLAQLEWELAKLRVAVDARKTPERAVRPVRTFEEEVGAMLLEAGRHMETERANPAEALVRYREVLQYFPDTHAAQQAQQRVDTLETSTT